MSLYFWILIFAFAGPFFLSFDQKVGYYKKWKYLLPAILSVALVFIIWDEYFTKKEIWGFTPAYIQEIYLGHLPLEEVLFFIIVPYNCVFIYEVLNAYFPSTTLSKLTKFFAFFFVLSGFVLSTWFLDNWYTSVACGASAILTVGLYFIFKVCWYERFAFAYTVALIPFLIVNGILTGMVTENPVVWYNESHIIGIRIGTIPFEDLYYNYCLFLPIIWLYEGIKNRFEKAIERR
jgi:lycopene cyclase domain-containing protein